MEDHGTTQEITPTTYQVPNDCQVPGVVWSGSGRGGRVSESSGVCPYVAELEALKGRSLLVTSFIAP